ncbi:MAG: alpha amylase [bacterium]|nr:MAG: alpha amylase [bacterium]
MILTRVSTAPLVGTLLVTGLLPLVPFAIPAARATSAWHADVSAGGGYDDDVLGRPGENSSFPILATGYWSLTPSLWGIWAPSRWSVSGGWSSAWNAYGSEEAGDYLDNIGQAGIGFRVDPKVQLRLDGKAEWFHRTEFQDYDFNRQEASSAVLWQVADAWSLQGSWSTGRIEYPERTTLARGGETQVDRPEEFEFGIGFEPGDRWRLEAAVTSLLVDSNSRQYEYSGDRLSLGVTGEIGRDWSVGAEAAWEQRDYDRFLYAIQLPSGAVRPGVGREDDSFSLALDLEHRITGTTRLFAGVAYLDYGSSLDDYAFDRLRLSGGVSVHFGKPAVSSLGGWDPAGSLNDWSPEANPMSGPTPDGTWETTINLEPGLYRYMFLVDTVEWLSPEGARLYEDDGFGQKNGVLEVGTPVTTRAGDGPTGVPNPR